MPNLVPYTSVLMMPHPIITQEGSDFESAAHTFRSAFVIINS